MIILNSVIIPNGKYNDAVELMEAGQYEEAISAFAAMDGYKDSAEKIEECEIAAIKTVAVGDYVYFGSYEQDNDESDGKEKIEWLVLDIQDGRALLISKYALDCQPYNEKETDVTWENCSLRTWLNDEFLNTAFSPAEQAFVPTVTVLADEDPSCDTEPGNDTQDQVFLLSISEAKEYFASNEARRCQPTNYAYFNGAHVADNGNCWWWLRSPGNTQTHSSNVTYAGVVNLNGDSVDRSGPAVRPAIRVELGE